MVPAPSLRPDCARDGLRILVVEDDDRIRRQIADYLAAGGHAIVEAASADHALQLLEGNGRAFDCVFSDVQMPGHMDGLALARWIRRNRPGLPVLLASGNVRADDLEPDLRATVPLMTKPYLGHAIETHMAALIARSAT
jgi:CheY-like chemotaxis protein